MKLYVLAAVIGAGVVGLGSCLSGESVGDGLRVMHDDVRGVTCWTQWSARGSGGTSGIACLPDRMLGGSDGGAP